MLHAFLDRPMFITKLIIASKLLLILKITARAIFGKEEKLYNMISILKKYQWVNFRENFLKLIKYNRNRPYMIGDWMRMKIMTKNRIKITEDSKTMKMMKITAKRKWFFKDFKAQHKTQQKICLPNFLKKNKKSIINKLRAKLLNKKLKWRKSN